MTTRLAIVRHGNTFKPGQISTRVGAQTDLDLVESHRGSSVGRYLKDNNLVPDIVFSSPLKRCMQTAQQALSALEIERELLLDDTFIEINYGPDENKTEEEVMLRLGKGDVKVGKKIIDRWNEEAILPDGWEVDVEQIVENWKNFTLNIASKYKGQTVMLVSSNGVIRLAPHITGDFKEFANNNEIKVSPGSVSLFELKEDAEHWKCTEWNSKPYKLYPKD
ncbi:histidine phosphatase family protein [uncultured Draconibacterium sp.]|uniref:histidine phosphatase family protein n=1 Tax=uncultured Draconibacterium sp. TaxID=1573823 RepID=UPI0029C92212|nr:histidine phosphatase family protein [uncultured Draconibacterium sp.]